MSQINPFLLNLLAQQNNSSGINWGYVIIAVLVLATIIGLFVFTKPIGTQIGDLVDNLGGKAGQIANSLAGVAQIAGKALGGVIPDKAPCANGLRDDGTSCWDDIKCNTTPITCRSVSDCISGKGCGCSGGVTTCSGTGSIKTTAFQRYQCPPSNNPAYTKLSGALCYQP